VTDSDNPLTPHQEEEVRRRLTEARHTGPPPPDVVARLDRVLDDLAHGPDRAAPVVDLARRRRRAATLLVAAAAVVAAGVGLSQVVSPQPDSASTSADESSARVDNGADAAPEPETDQGADSGAHTFPTDGDVQEKSELLTLRRDHLAADLTDARRRLPTADARVLRELRSADRAAGVLCGADAWGEGRFVAVRYGDTPAVLVFRRAVGDTQVADVFLCGSEEPVRSVTLPAP
jgi:hypothetical protein